MHFDKISPIEMNGKHFIHGLVPENMTLIVENLEPIN